MYFDSHLTVIDEAEALPVAGLAALQDVRGAAARLPLEPVDGAIGHEAVRLGGLARDAWPFDLTPPPISAPALCRVRDVLVFPGSGTVVQAGEAGRGRIFAAASGEILHRWPDLAGLPHVSQSPAGPHLSLRRPPPNLASGALFMPWGGGFNYGHFLLDGLTSLLALEEAGLLAGTQVLAPRLAAWQKGLLDLLFPGLAVRSLSVPVVHLETAVYATSMDHFLHAPDALVQRLAGRIAGSGGLVGKVGGPRRLYLSRRGQSMRVMTNEAALEAALMARGFAIIRPERLSPRDQIALMRGAELVVAPTGAALANAMFLPSGAQVIEIQPENFTSRWVLATTRQVGVRWSGYICASPTDPARAPLLIRLRRGFRFAYTPPLDDLLAFVDEALQHGPSD